MAAVYDVPVNKIDGAPAKLADYKGKVLLVVNVASKCGLTPQYEGLEKLYEDKRGQGLEVLGFPANNFGAQEPGTNDEIAEFCTSKFDVKFPLFSKISVKGADQHALYKEMIRQQPKTPGAEAMRERLAKAGMPAGEDSDVVWNFEKFLVSRKGDVVGRFAPNTPPNDPALTAAIDAELAKPA
jgi:glutathione peroxidase